MTTPTLIFETPVKRGNSGERFPFDYRTPKSSSVCASWSSDLSSMSKAVEKGMRVVGVSDRKGSINVKRLSCTRALPSWPRVRERMSSSRVNGLRKRRGGGVEKRFMASSRTTDEAPSPSRSPRTVCLSPWTSALDWGPRRGREAPVDGLETSHTFGPRENPLFEEMDPLCLVCK